MSSNTGGRIGTEPEPGPPLWLVCGVLVGLLAFLWTPWALLLYPVVLIVVSACAGMARGVWHGMREGQR